ncbi:UNVERIFIED_CONTAM: putative AC transposase [Sesamum calycinum]|uniref:AC transposase n=1 Tax=Sesamum calycinum TaxID=2727403 RepID=A0AAW2IZV2_9LAMI
MQSEEATLEKTTSATNEEMTNGVDTDTIDIEENVTNKDDENLGQSPNVTKNQQFGSDYPTSNLFLNEVSGVKVLLDKKALENDIFIRDMVAQMKSKFDKYWGESNLLVSIAAVLDPRCKLRTLEFCFPKLYSSKNVERWIAAARKTLYELYLLESIQPQKSELDLCLEENCYIFEKDKKDGKDFDVLEWWRVHALKYKILSIMARDLLAIPITTVASEATCSAGSRVIDKYRALLTSDMVQVLMCGGDWMRKRFGVKKKSLGVYSIAPAPTPAPAPARQLVVTEVTRVRARA